MEPTGCEQIRIAASQKNSRTFNVLESLMSSVCFDVEHLYYLTQYLPVYRELRRRGVEVQFLLHHSDVSAELASAVEEHEGIEFHWCKTSEEMVEFYKTGDFDWIVFGNGCKHITELPERSRTAQLYHGIGMKNDVYKSEIMQMDVRFVEGPYYTEELNRLFPGCNLQEVGYAKMDPLLGENSFDKVSMLREWKLDPAKQTVLYAPTFYPSSIECMADDFPADIDRYNLIIRPHFFSFTKSRYRAQREKFDRWQQYPNVYFAPKDRVIPVPYLAVADLLISEASSMLFEFAALDKPAIWCDFLKLRWTYKGPLRFRLNRRMDSRITRYHDIAVHAASYSELTRLIGEQLQEPHRFSDKRRQYCTELMGSLDGDVSKRIADYLFES